MGKLEQELCDFYHEVRSFLGIDKEDQFITSLEDHKNIFQNDILLMSKSCNPHVDPSVFQCNEQYGSVYYTHYTASFACFAQLQRHRRISYKIFPLSFSPAASNYAKKFTGNNYTFYIPRMIRNTHLEYEWINDMDNLTKKVDGGLLQGSLCLVYEKGNIEDFVNSKCKERLCARAQLEIQDVTVDTVKRFMAANIVQDLEYEEAILLRKLVKDYDSSEVHSRCNFMQCKEPCPLGRNGLKRKW
jgi:hypothetical protein